MEPRLTSFDPCAFFSTENRQNCQFQLLYSPNTLSSTLVSMAPESGNSPDVTTHVYVAELWTLWTVSVPTWVPSDHVPGSTVVTPLWVERVFVPSVKARVTA